MLGESLEHFKNLKDKDLDWCGVKSVDKFADLGVTTTDVEKYLTEKRCLKKKIHLDTE
jgi:hypothetical protein